MTVRAADAFSGVGGLRIFTQSWLPDAPGPPRAVVVIVHGLGEHSDRYDAVAQQLVAQDIAVYACDHRGHGRSPGPREMLLVADVVADLDTLVSSAGAAWPGVPLFMLGHSLGGMLALRYALAHQSRLSGLVLSGALAAVDAPAIVQRLGRLVAAVAPSAGLIKLDPQLVSRDPAVVAAYRADPLVHHGRVPAQTLAEITETVARLPQTIGAITVPTLVLYGTADGLCPPRGSAMLAERLGPGDLTVRAYEGLYHEVLNEPEREMVLGDVVGWLAARVPAAAPRS